jgi:divalent metal cation (Fe/Co/Zn/Cd) transporter
VSRIRNTVNAYRNGKPEIAKKSAAQPASPGGTLAAVGFAVYNNKPYVSKPVTTKKVLSVSFLVDSLDVLINITIALLTGSTVMLAVTSTFSFYSGLQRWLHPEKIEYLGVAYGALAVAVFSNGYATILSLRKIMGQQKLNRLPQEFVESSDITPRITLVLDAAGTLAAAFGLITLIIYGITGDSKFDGLGAMIIGTLLLVMALVLLATTKGLVTGKSASSKIKRKITQATMQIPQVNSVLDLRTMMMGPDNLLINAKVHLKDDLSTDEIEKIIDDIKENIRKDLKGTAHITIEPETPPKSRPRL